MALFGLAAITRSSTTAINRRAIATTRTTQHRHSNSKHQAIKAIIALSSFSQLLSSAVALRPFTTRLSAIKTSTSTMSMSTTSTSSCTGTTTGNTMIDEAQSFCNDFNYEYEKKHYAFERQFWGGKMALSGDFSTAHLSQTQSALEDYLSDPRTLQKAQDFKAGLPTSTVTVAADGAPDTLPLEDLVNTLDVIIRTCKCNDKSSSPEAKGIREEAINLENELTGKRNVMKLGYVDPESSASGDDNLKEMSSVGLRNLMRVSPDEKLRKAAYEGLCSIGPFVTTNGFVELVKLRNKFAKSLGYVDFYDYKVTNAEGFGKDKLFNDILDGLEVATRPLMQQARTELERRHGKSALEPWNTSYQMAGELTKKMDPYFPFSKAVERYLKTYAALHISYQGSVLNLDLLDRKNKYSNGFCHWPKTAWRKPDGSWQPAEANFTSLADPSAIGSGLTALQTLMHEGGHAAHFANIKQPSPLFSQERAPTSVAYAENQSMFLDSLVGDASWRAKYALSTKNDPIPFDIIAEEILATHPFKVFQLRSMLVVSYFEKALYELPDDQVTSENIQALAEDTELLIQGGKSARPLLSVPHIISDEASCYYHGYTLAEMSVHQTRDYFLQTDGYIVDNPHVGPALTESYWKCGNARPFLDLVTDLTGTPLSGDAWVTSLKESAQDCVVREKKEYEEMRSKIDSKGDDVNANDDGNVDDLNMTVRFVDGDTLISDSSTAKGGLLGACQEFEDFVNKRVQEASTTK